MMPIWRFGDVAVGGLQELEDDVFDVFADVAGLGEGGRVDDGEGDIEHLGEGLCQERFAGAGGADEEDIGLGDLDIVAAGAVHLHALVVVVDGDGELLFGLVLADDVFVEEGLDFCWLGQVRRGGVAGLRPRRFVVFEDGVADGDALVADVGARIIAGRRNQFCDGVLRLVAERAAERFFEAPGSLHGRERLLSGAA